MRCPVVLCAFVCIAALSTPAQVDTSRREESANNTSAVRGTPENGNVQPGNVSKLSIRSLLYPGATTKIYVRYMPWFGDRKHIDVGYRSDDERQIERQVTDMMSRGVDGAIVDWYGPEDKAKNRVTEMLVSEAERRGFTVAVSVDKGALRCDKNFRCNATGELIDAMRYAIEHFAKSPAYARVNGRPLMTFFGLENADIDWHRVRREVPDNPLLLFRNSGGFTHDASDGAFSWIAPETVKPDDSRGFKYIRRFNQAAREHPDKFAMASAYKGFDDSLASWGKGRKIAQDCGRTWLASFKDINSDYSAPHQLAALIIPTWNDYEEGTAIEPGIDNCVRISAVIDGDRLRWKSDGPLETIDHFAIYATNARASSRIVAEVPPRTDWIQIANLKLTEIDKTLFVKAIGKPSLLNQLSEPVRLPDKSSR